MDSKTAARVGRIGGHVTASRYNMAEFSERARKAFMSKFELEVDPDGVLDPAERARRAGHARQAFFARLALKSAQARAKKKPRTR